MGLESGTALSGRYEILGQLGAGGMGEVYRARDHRLGRDVAIKVLPERLATDDAAKARFDREAKALATISHSNILTIHDFGTDQEVCFTVTELLAGETVRALLARGPVPWQRAVEIGVAAASGLAAAHARGITHRDIKPENVFLTADGGIKILDFGLARSQCPALAGDQDTTPTGGLDTRPGLLLGTVPYMSPEQIRGLEVDARSDIFSLGCVLYELLAGHAPFSGASIPDTLAAILLTPPPPLADPGREVPPELERVVVSCLEKERAQRFQSAQDLALALKSISYGSSPVLAPAPPPRPRPKRRRRSKAIRSIAVLPVVNPTGDPESEYLIDGLTEGIIHSLSQLPKLRVMARSTVFRYKDRAVDPQAVGDHLGVGSVLTGWISRRGDALTLDTELVDVQDGSRMWGERYALTFSDLPSVQEEIARRLSEKLRVGLSGADRERLAKRYTEDAEAYHLYLKGRYYWAKRTGPGLETGIAFFEKAVARDPTYALAYAGLADCYNMLQYYGTSSPTEAMAKTKAMALRALELDSDLPEPHTSLGGIKLYHDWDWKGAEEEFRRALALNPNHVPARHWYGELLNIVGRTEEAMRQFERGMEVDPLSLLINGSIADILLSRRQADEAIKQYQKTLEIDPSSESGHFWLGLAYELKGSFPEAIAEFRRAVEMSGGHPEYLAALGHAFARSGERGQGRRVLDDLEAMSRQTYISAYHFAALHAGLEDWDLALACLKKAYEERAARLIYLRVDPRFDPCRSDPRLEELTRHLELLPSSARQAE